MKPHPNHVKHTFSIHGRSIRYSDSGFLNWNSILSSVLNIINLYRRLLTKYSSYCGKSSVIRRHPNHVKHTDRRSTGGRYDNTIQWLLKLELYPQLCLKYQHFVLKAFNKVFEPSVLLDFFDKYILYLLLGLNSDLIPSKPCKVKHADRLFTGAL